MVSLLLLRFVALGFCCLLETLSRGRREVDTSGANLWSLSLSELSTMTSVSLNGEGILGREVGSGRGGGLSGTNLGV